MTPEQGFPAHYQVVDADTWPADVVLEAGAGTIQRVVSVTPVNAPSWTAALSAPRPLSTRAFSGNVTTPRPDVVLLLASGAAWWVPVSDPQHHQVIATP